MDIVSDQLFPYCHCFFVSFNYLAHFKYAHLNTVEQEKNAQMRTIGERLRSFALTKYGKINDFADALGMGAPNVQAYMRGSRKPGTSVLQRIQKLGCNVDWLLTGKGEMFEVKNGGKPCENHRSTLDQEADNRELIERFNGMDKTKPYYLLAIGRRLAVHQEGIKESDVLLIDPTMQAIENDLIVRSTPEGAEVARYQSQDSNVMGVVVKLIREYPSLDRAK